MSRWTHPICLWCWEQREPQRSPTHAGNALERCCFCGKTTTMGIYVREDPTSVRCHGTHEVPA